MKLQKKVHIFTGEQTGTPQQGVPITAGLRHRLLKMSKLQTSGDVPPSILLWAALQVKHIDLKEQGLSGM